jgi:hypothetical protein
MAIVAVAGARDESSGNTPVGAHDRLFYGGMAIAMAVVVFVGFAPTYYVRFVAGGPRSTVTGGPFTPLVHLHGALFTGWVLLFIAQTALVASHRVAVHRRLGWAGTALAAAMILVGTSTAVATARRGGAPPGVDPLAFLAIPIFDMLLFATFVTAALVLRRNRETHKRLMLLAYISIIVAAVARLPGLLPLGPLAFFGLGYFLLVVAVAYDLVSRRRVHRVYLWGGALMVASVPLRLMIADTGSWRAFAQMLTK